MRCIRSFSLVAAFIIGLVSVSFITDSSDNRQQTAGNFQLTTHHSPLTADTLQYPSETHLKNIQQLTFGGDNAEAYFSFDGKWIIFRANFEGTEEVYAVEIAKSAK